MPRLLSVLTLCFICLSCSTKDFEKNYGLRFKEIDWKKSLERPFIINSDVSPSLEKEKSQLFLPAKLFNNTDITAVYYNNMKSSNVEYIDGEKKRMKISFDGSKDELKNFPYNLEIDQAVVEIAVLKSKKIIRIEDIRVPFYHKDVSEASNK